HALGDRASDGALNVHLDLRVRLFELRKHLGEQIKAGSFVCAKPQCTASETSQLADRLNGFIAKPEQFFAVVAEKLSCRGEPYDAAHPVEERLAQFLFEELYGRANGGLGASEPFAGARKTFFAFDCRKHLELP